MIVRHTLLRGSLAWPGRRHPPLCEWACHADGLLALCSGKAIVSPFERARGALEAEEMDKSVLVSAASAAGDRECYSSTAGRPAALYDSSD